MEREGRKLLIIAKEVLALPLMESLRNGGFEILTASESERAGEILDRNRIDILLFDLLLHGPDGLDALSGIKRKAPRIPLLVLSPSWNMDKAARALEMGAEAVIPTPVHPLAARLQVTRILEKKELFEENRLLKRRLEGAPPERHPVIALKKALEEPERRIILDALEACGFNRQRTARALKINRTTLYNKMKRLGLLKKGFEGRPEKAP